MNVKERKNKDGSMSCDFRCSVKNANGRFETKIMTLRVPSNIKGKKAREEWKLKEALAWKEKLGKSSSKYTIPKSDMLFVDFARQFIDNILTFNKTSYNYYISCKANLKTVEKLLGKYTLSEITPPVMETLCRFLCERKYKKYIITAKPALAALIDEKDMTLQCLSKGCEIAPATLYAVIHGQQITRTTAKKICNYLHIPMEKYFSMSVEEVPYSKGANVGVKTFVHTVLHEAVRLQLIPVNYASAEFTRPVTGTVGKKIILESIDEYKEFIGYLNAEKDIRKKAAFGLLLYTGARTAEIMGMTWDRVNIDERTIYISQNTMYCQSFGIVSKAPKTQTSKRTISIPTALVEILKDYKIWWEQAKVNHGDLWANTNKLFVQDNGKDMAGNTVATWLRAFELKNGLKQVSAHGFRHSFITLGLAHGVDIKTISAHSGHSSPDITLQVYSHYTKEADRQAVDTIDKLLKS